jgi:hypothetical protein
MRKPSRLANLAALMLLSAFSFALSATAAPIPADAASQPKTLWRLVMEDYYGPYDRAKKCWVARIDGEQVCMRPHRLDQVAIHGVNHLFLVVGGTRLGDDGHPQESHADSGALGLIILKAEGVSLKLVAKNDLHSSFGTFGAVPSEDQFAVREIGPGETYGWVATSGWMGQGIVIESSAIFTAVGDKVVSIGDIPSHYDNSGNCENGKVLGSDTPCTDYSAELLFDSADKGGRFFPVIMKVTGTREGVTLDKTFTTTFDTDKLTYRPIDGLPEEFANGI